jgi:uncharacterized protein YlbG (UPF0298 family)
MFAKRIGLAVWLHHLKMARHLRRFGNVHYVSQKMRYAILYVDEKRADDTIKKLNRLNYVKRVDISKRHELKTEFQNAKRDRAKEFDYKMGGV